VETGQPVIPTAILGELVFNAHVHNDRDVVVTMTVTQVKSGQVEIRVADDRAEVPPARRPGLFNVNSVRADHGFGLPYCYQIARTHTGDLKYVSPTAEGDGAFVLTLLDHQPDYRGRTMHDRLTPDVGNEKLVGFRCQFVGDTNRPKMSDDRLVARNPTTVDRWVDDYNLLRFQRWWACHADTLARRVTYTRLASGSGSSRVWWLESRNSFNSSEVTRPG